MFRGWDWSELAEVWGVYLPYDILDEPDHYEYEPLVWYIELALSRANFCETRVIKKMAKDVREYAVALATDGHTYMGPLWIGLSKIESDVEILRTIIGKYPLIAAMWD